MKSTIDVHWRKEWVRVVISTLKQQFDNVKYILEHKYRISINKTVSFLLLTKRNFRFKCLVDQEEVFF